ncbi:type 2 lactosamine alpha-2,3-sialyltransferase-like isoform X1 [Petromyzon marinus]|uniref:Type 2 lactosamine alpha-2,3-sialyltransferase-like n=2 Tax=Petromyzon marinus TaxID=7757 RepID=A0AAJ7XGS4_PETMA|nr:type 2 lactosamine alpha-2,3-sialyltransferase-like [Petromyzon marinus]XP_032832702.1 type 2 lactosamine alpha-2,3-sialyltransferase-like [Petromyzon marinus]XP_032832703.1 type 2 lactosamine alpha-2,3-sialyltransferase-like [Petromyzon marinus]
MQSRWHLLKIMAAAAVLFCLYGVFQFNTLLRSFAIGTASQHTSKGLWERFQFSQKTHAAEATTVSPRTCRPLHVRRKLQGLYPHLNMSALGGSPFLGLQDVEAEATRSHRRNYGAFALEQLPYRMRPSDALTIRWILKLLVNVTTPRELSNLACKRCVVVGNGRVLKGSGLGKRIDSYDVVLRMNDAPLRGHVGDVGSRTTMRLCYPESAHVRREDFDPSALLAFVPFKTRDLQWLLGVLNHHRVGPRGFWKKVPTELQFPASRIRILNPAFVREAATEFLNISSDTKSGKAKNPTTGVIAITLALHLCDEVHLAGFGYEVNSPGSPVHYYGQDTMSSIIKSTYHNITIERTFLRKLKEGEAIVDLTQLAGT